MQTNSNSRKCFEREKKAYWAMREELLKQYKGKWVAIINGRLAAIGEKRGKVMADAYRKTKSKVMFVSEVGYEERVLRIRQISIGNYDHDYEPEIPMKLMPVSDIALNLCAKRNIVQFEWIQDENG